ncbi:MAG: S26 family signal peptidase, partial [Actinomycetes bacterium]
IKPGAGTDQVQFDIVVPPSSVFVMGDNRSQSADSRFHMGSNQGAVPLGDVVGRAVLKVWPLGSFGTIPIPATFDNPALSKQPKASAPAPFESAAGDDPQVN